MHGRDRQREKTREKIIGIAVEVFAAKGFRAAATRDIAARARVSQALLTYHFGGKEELWRAAMDRIFADLRENFRAVLENGPVDPLERMREGLRQYVRFVAAHPELFRVMVEEGKRPDARMRWLVDTHLVPIYAAFEAMLAGARAGRAPLHSAHAYYAVAGAASLIFAIAPECRRLTGVDPRDPKVVETHAEMIVKLVVP